MTSEKVMIAAYSIKENYQYGVIKDIEFPQLVNMKTGEYIGIGVIFQVSTKYDYSMAIIEEWKKELHADDWKVNSKRNQLFITFYVHFA